MQFVVGLLDEKHHTVDDWLELGVGEDISIAILTDNTEISTHTVALSRLHLTHMLRLLAIALEAIEHKVDEHWCVELCGLFLGQLQNHTYQHPNLRWLVAGPNLALPETADYWSENTGPTPLFLNHLLSCQLLNQFLSFPPYLFSQLGIPHFSLQLSCFPDFLFRNS